MSKIGRRPINLQDVQVTLDGNVIRYKGKKAEGVHEIPKELKASMVGDELHIDCEKRTGANKMLWGLHRALLANEIAGARDGFAQDVIITGLGFKGVLTGNKIVFSLGYSHKIDFELPKGINVDIDKTGQKITVKGTDKHLVGFVCSEIKSFRPTEPYKGTGIKLPQDVILRKVGKKSA